MPVDLSMGLYYHFEHTLFEIKNNHIFGHGVLTSATKVKFLADIIKIPPPYFWPKTISLGDICIDIGMIVMILSLIFFKKNKKYESFK